MTSFTSTDPAHPFSFVGDLGLSMGASQVTTSYRTGRAATGGVGLETEEDTAILSGRNYAERFGALKAQSDRHETASPYDTGHAFSSVKYELQADRISERYRQPGFAGSYTDNAFDGHVYSVPSYHEISGHTWTTMDPPDVGYYGPKAFKATRPTAPTADLAVGLAELKREGLPSRRDFTDVINKVRGSHKGINLNPGDAYLAAEFGWKPLIRDLTDTLHAVTEAKAILKQYQRDSGKNIRRQYAFPPLITVDERPLRTGRLACYSNSTAGDVMFQGENPFGSLRETIQTERYVWFSGAFSYYLQQEGTNLLDKMDEFSQKANRLLGIRITPEVLWNLAPWSWLVDWQVNIGDNIANATALSSDGLVLRYGYLMVTTITTHSAVITGPVTRSGRTGPWVTTWKQTRKERFRAQPYGFGSNPASYTNRQWAILGALGLSHTPGHLIVK